MDEILKAKLDLLNLIENKRNQTYEEGEISKALLNDYDVEDYIKKNGTSEVK